VDPGGKVLVLLLDNAGWHRAKDLQVPPGLPLRFVPISRSTLRSSRGGGVRVDP